MHGADLHDRKGARRIVATFAPNDLSPIELVWADQSYTGALARWIEERRGWRLQVVRHAERQLWRYGLEERLRHTFRVLPRRWAGAPWASERTFAWLGQSPRLSKDYERLPEVSEAMIYSTMSRLMLRRLARTAA